ncbi:MAG: ATP-binding protein [Bacteroidales bacterium]|nr:ATP-binding protein [Bacteroidales bacterium]
MRTISEHIMDIVQNSIRAHAKNILIEINAKNQTLNIRIEDDGNGIDEQMLQSVKDPFFTTRTTRKVGLGLPLLKQNTVQTGGYLNVKSKKNVGTVINAVFNTDSIDCLPLGDIYTSIALLITGNPRLNIDFKYSNGSGNFKVSSEEIKKTLNPISINTPKVSVFLKELIKENLENINVDFC